ncbi:hypothetical protein R3W88_008036 [Solanum pinnatisectum]|uniref:RNase H type-1 domain-containing protein n=1 Tax=Solanum pinnatisectum TaxID=50273 RepID=A0AAV9MA82_9SOLN|nr:hypothetical protein R3W88_008036 [Solanum pinnatisectum]
MMRNKHTVEKHILWKLRNGSSFFWWDNWLGVGPLAHYINISKRFNNDRIVDFMKNGQWNLTKLNQLAPQNMVHKILSTQIQLQQEHSDQAVWTLSATGLFSVSSAWNSIRTTREETKINTYTWHKRIPLNVPSYYGVQSEANFPPMKGWPALELNQGFVIVVNPQVLIPLNIPSTQEHLPKRCSKKYGGKQSSIARVKFLVMLDTFKLLQIAFPYITWPLEWRRLYTLIENCFHDTKITIVQWNRPPDEWVKINTDGSALNNPGIIGAGGIIRNKNGELILAFATPLGEGTNNQAEVEAAILGLSWCVNLRYDKVILEVDSQLLVDWFKNSTAATWSLYSQMQKLQHIATELTQVKCTHILREANYVADSLAKYSHQITYSQIYSNTQQLPKLAATYFQQDSVW